MGESEGQFTSDPKDTKDRTKMFAIRSKYILSVLQAINELKGSNGSTESEITAYIQATINENIIPKGRNFSMQIKNTLQYATKHGLVKQSGQKFLIGLDKNNCEIFNCLKDNDWRDICRRKRPISQQASRDRNRKRQRKEEISNDGEDFIQHKRRRTIEDTNSAAGTEITNEIIDVCEENEKI